MKKPKDQQPECFYKDHFSMAVCGAKIDRLHDIIDAHAVQPFVEGIGFDEPPSAGTKVELAMGAFQSMNFDRVPLLPLSIDQFFQFACKFRDWERYVHPRHQPHLPSKIHPYRPYFDPVYETIEKAYQARDEMAVKAGIGTLLDKIIHL